LFKTANLQHLSSGEIAAINVKNVLVYVLMYNYKLFGCYSH